MQTIGNESLKKTNKQNFFYYNIKSPDFPAALHPPLSSHEGNEVLWVCLVIMENNIHAGVDEHIHHTVKSVMALSATAMWRHLHVSLA